MKREIFDVSLLFVGATVVAIALVGACAQAQGPEGEAPPGVIHARFDPDAKVIPMPSNVLRDDTLRVLDLPADDADITAAEREFYTFLNTLDGWPSTMQASVELTGPIAVSSITADNLQVWRWGNVPERVDAVTVEVSANQTKITIDPDKTGWQRGGTYVVMLRGGDEGVTGLNGERVVCDAAFYFLRQTVRLDTPDHERAFPGNTSQERRDKASEAELIRLELAPYFEFFEDRGLDRKQVAALWSFTITERSELAMDKLSQRMPLPINLLINPDTQMIDIPAAAWDSDVEVEAKHRLSEFNGFGVSTNLLFGFTGKMDPGTINDQTVKLYQLDGIPTPVEANVTLMSDQQHVVIEPKTLPLAEDATYAVIVTRAVLDERGSPAMAMPVGHLLAAREKVFTAGASQIGAVADEDARLVEGVRQQITALLDQHGREQVLAAWPFTTMSIKPRLRESVAMAETLSVSPTPKNIVRKTPFEAMADFLLGFAALTQVSDVYTGTIESPVFLDPITRSWRSDGTHEVKDIAFTMFVPNSVDSGEPLKTIIFSHAILTDSRFVLALGDALAQRGFAAIAIDLPMHGTRTHCLSTSPLSTVDPSTGELSEMDPCQAGTTCSEDGRCVDASGNGNALATWPVVGMPVASGAAFIEIEHIANTSDHFRQALVDLGALARSLRKGDWNSAIGHPIETGELYFAGMSLGSIIGATYLTFDHDIKRAVLNVGGADAVDLFSTSPFFSGHVDGFFIREGIEKGSYEHERFMNVARWLIDSVDPQSVGGGLAADQAVLIQMATQDTIIPNEATLTLERVSGASRRDYNSDHIFLVLPFDPNFGPGQADMGDFLAGTLAP